MSRRWPPIVRHALHAARRPYVGPNKRQKWEYQCAECGGWFKGDCVAVDHIAPAGKLTAWDDVEPFLRRLLCEADGLRVVCDCCHDGITAKQREERTSGMGEA
jgi:hypothetical protein